MRVAKCQRGRMMIWNLADDPALTAIVTRYIPRTSNEAVIDSQSGTPGVRFYIVTGLQYKIGHEDNFSIP